VAAHDLLGNWGRGVGGWIRASRTNIKVFKKRRGGPIIRKIGRKVGEEDR